MCICIHDERGLASSCAFICDLLHAFFNFPMTLIKSLNLKLKKWLTHVFSQFPARKPSLRLIWAIFYNCKIISHHSTTTYVQSLSTWITFYEGGINKSPYNRNTRHLEQIQLLQWLNKLVSSNRNVNFKGKLPKIFCFNLFLQLSSNEWHFKAV